MRRSFCCRSSAARPLPGRPVEVHHRGGEDRVDDPLDLIQVERGRRLLDRAGLLEGELADYFRGRVGGVDVAVGDAELHPAAGLAGGRAGQRQAESLVAVEADVAAEPGHRRR